MPGVPWLRSRSEVEWLGFVLALAALAAVTVLDFSLGATTVLTGSYILAPFITALTGGRRATAFVGLAAIALGAASGAWNQNAGSSDFEVRLGLLVLGCGFAYFAAAARHTSLAAMRRFQILDEIAAVADGALPLAETLQRVTDVIVPEVADFCMIDIKSEGGPTRAAVRAGGPRSAEVEEWLSRREPTLPDYLFRDEEMPQAAPWFVPKHSDEFRRRISHDREDFEFLRSLGTRSSIGIGIGARGRRLGALTLVTAWSRRRYRAADVRFVRVLAGRVGLVLDNAGLFSDLQSVERRMDTAMSILGEAVLIQDRRGRLMYANDAAGEMFGIGAVEPGSAPLEEIRDRYELYEEGGDPLEVSESVALRVLRGEPGGDQTIRAVERQSGRQLWLRARSRAIEGPDGQPLYAVTTLDDITDIKQGEFAQGMLARTGELLASSIDYRQTLQGVARLTIPGLADWCAVYAPGQNGTVDLLAIAHPDPEKVRMAREALAEFPMALEDEVGPAAVLRTGEPVFAEDADSAIRAYARDERHVELLREVGIGSMVMVPMLVPSKVNGVLVLARDAESRPFDDSDRSLAARIAERAAIAIENSRLATERANIAETLQRGLAPPHIPDVPGWSVAAVYRPAGAENRVGGDFYDVFPYHGGWMLVIGDVTGRGAEAAAVTALARYTIRTAGTLTGDPPVALDILNASLRLREGNALCTAAIVTLPGPDDPDEVRIAVAGHPPPLILEGGTVAEGGRLGPVLGAFDDAEWELDVKTLTLGAQIVAYTDGVIEASGVAGRFGEERLRGRLAGASSPAAAIRRVEQALEEFTEGGLADDAAIVAVMREGVPARRRATATGGTQRAAR